MFRNVFLEKEHLDMETVHIFVNLCLRNNFTYQYQSAHEEITGYSDHSICDWASFCREVLIKWCLKKEDNTCGPGNTVEIDESKFGKQRPNVGWLVEG